MVPVKAAKRGPREPSARWQCRGRVLRAYELSKGTEGGTQMPRTSSPRLRQIARVAAENKEFVFRNLAHLIDEELLHEAYSRTSGSAAAGIDQMTKREYGEQLATRLRDLHQRLVSQTYRATPSRRGYVPKDGGTMRPIALPVVEDKLVQRATVLLLQEVYEQDFYPFSYGFRPGRNPHQALVELRQQCAAKNIGWIVDADIKGFFDNLDRTVLQDLLHRRVKDGGIDRLIGKWFAAGILEGKELLHPETGTPQGSVVSPMLANIYLHHALDEWFAEVAQRHLKGRSFLIRYADDFVIGCELEADAQKMLRVLPLRLAKYGLEIHPEKTRLVRFRRPSSRDDGSGNGTFDFLGFTHYWGKTRRGGWLVKRKTAKKRLTRAIRAAYVWCRFHRHDPLSQQQRILSSKLRGHYRYYGVRNNFPCLRRLYQQVKEAWRKWLGRRSRASYISYERMDRLLIRYPLTKPRIMHDFG